MRDLLVALGLVVLLAGCGGGPSAAEQERACREKAPKDVDEDWVGMCVEGNLHEWLS